MSTYNRNSRIGPFALAAAVALGTGCRSQEVRAPSLYDTTLAGIALPVTTAHLDTLDSQLALSYDLPESTTEARRSRIADLRTKKYFTLPVSGSEHTLNVYADGILVWKTSTLEDERSRVFVEKPNTNAGVRESRIHIVSERNNGHVTRTTYSSRMPSVQQHAAYEGLAGTDRLNLDELADVSATASIGVPTDLVEFVTDLLDASKYDGRSRQSFTAAPPLETWDVYHFSDQTNNDGSLLVSPLVDMPKRRRKTFISGATLEDLRSSKSETLHHTQFSLEDVTEGTTTTRLATQEVTRFVNGKLTTTRWEMTLPPDDYDAAMSAVRESQAILNTQLGAKTP